jgi:NDP-sugar pyrophosphorylase family protein
LYPFTKDRPKALVEVKGISMLEHTLRKMQTCGITDVVVNVHAFADKVEAFLKSYAISHPEIRIQVSDERDLLLETGGGLKKMQPMLADDSFLVHNVDVLSTVNLNMLRKADDAFVVKNPNHLATLAVRKIQSDRYFLFNGEGLLCGWENVKTGQQKISRPEEKDLQRFGFTGIHLIHPALFPLMIEEGVFSITDVYLRLATRHEIRMVDVSDARWFDIGSPEQLRLAEEKADWI